MLRVKDDNIDQILEDHDLLVLDLWASWCPPCRGYSAVFDKVASKRRDATFGKCDIDANEEIADSLGIEGVPTTVIFRAGQPVLGAVGALTAVELGELIDQARALDPPDADGADE